jgi:two-component system KDP operon response regulator KdpE
MSKLNPSIVVIDDDPQVRRVLDSGLSAHDFMIYQADCGARGLALVASRKPDLVILDLGLPDMDGVDVVRKLREWAALPIVVLSARNLEHDKVALYAAGVDDYVEKPFGLLELIARIRVALRRAVHNRQFDANGVFRLGELTIDFSARRVARSGTRVSLSPLEFRLLTVLVRNADKVVSHRQLLAEVWGPGHQDRVEYLRIYMQSLRRKLEVHAARPSLLLTEPSIGYRLSTESAGATEPGAERLAKPQTTAREACSPQA